MEDFSFKSDLDMNVPAAYAVFQIILNGSRKKADDALYVYANKAYCEIVGRDRLELIGRNFRSVYDNADAKWFDYCYEAAFEGKTDTGPHVQPGSEPLAGICSGASE